MNTKPSIKPAVPIIRWAAIGTNGIREWIHHDTLRYTRRDARAAYLAWWDEDPKAQRAALKRVRFARVVVSIEGEKS